MKQRKYRVEIVDHEFIRERWSEIEEALSRAFSESAFNGRFTRIRPAEHTWEVIHQPEYEGCGHVVAQDAEGRILGAFFAVPVRMSGSEECDLGWMYTDELERAVRREVMDVIIQKTHETVRTAGFRRVVTEMGTEAGAKFLSKRHGYIHAPTKEQFNRWIKELGEEST